ncbi:molecular chaperone DnaK [Candidatus Aminicenantes bacterium AC-335-A11]|nr:molecular chaperone DnaK [SCandidatus Aminicenantes bacterium Aminicenantia_JdfR_composite]MCP2598019.1 molecular chaperone DnaK [Candidatus Aminicenantes bacterium AC-335-L06]MCP2618797.1 molecular chaperone DnaK [Candidatus Aminicenantes bacterium AC-335-A11]
MEKVIGIDLGTTYSCIAYLEGKNPVVIPNLEGTPTTPSIVAFLSSGEKLVGNIAYRQILTNPENTIYSVKRLIGKKYNTPEVQEMKKRVSFQLKEAQNGDVRIVVQDKEYSPEEISAFILKYLKECAESFLGTEIKEIVITVPAHFDDGQRQATKNAAIIAGLDVIRVINEPTAACLAYGLDKKKEGLIAVYDLGGGTFDISILEVREGVFNVLSTTGNTFLGGNDFDARIMDWLIDEFKEENGVDLSQDKMALQRIKEASEKAKKDLSYVLETEISLPFIYSDENGSKHLAKTLTREKLERLTEDLVEKTIPYIKQALNDASLSPEDIDEVVMVGGQTKMPLVRKIVSDFFGKPVSAGINPETVVALGAAIQSGIAKGLVKDFILLDVTPLSLGVETENDTFTKIIERNTTIPTKKSKIFTTVEDNQTKVRIHVLQGEREVASANISLGMFELVGIEPAPAGVPQIEVTFEIDANGIVHVSARDMATGKEQKIEVYPSTGLSQDEIEKIIKEAEEYADKDKEEIEIQKLKKKIEQQIFTLRLSFFQYKDELKLSEEVKNEIIEILQKEDILKTNNLEEIKRYSKILDKHLNLITSKMNDRLKILEEEGIEEIKDE